MIKKKLYQKHILMISSRTHHFSFLSRPRDVACQLGRTYGKQIKAAKFGCNKIMLISAETMKSESHYFTVKTEVRETTMESMLKKIYDRTLLNLITLLY